MQKAQYHNNSNPVNFISVEAEQSVIGGLMLNNSAWSEVSNIISKKDFAQSRHQKIFAVMQSLVKQNSPIDPVTVASELQNKKGAFEAVGGSEYLGHLAGNTPSVDNIVAYARIVKERCIQRQIEAAHKSHKSGAVILGLEGELELLRNPPTDEFSDRYTWRRLCETEQPKPNFLVQGVIPEGVVILAGAPKTKKSFFAGNLGVAVSGGGEFLGHKVEQADVLYIALEDTPRRMQDRIRPMIAGGMPDPDEHLIIDHRWKPLGAGGEEDIESHLKEYPKTKLIMIDTLAKLRPGNSSSSNMYQDDYQLFNKLTTITKNNPGLTILLVHHVRKTKSEDVFESISGSAGILGAVDSALVLGVNGKDTVNARLHITGRDVMERRDDDALVMYFNDLDLTWKLSDEAVSVGNYDDDVILAAIKNGVHSPRDLADYTGISYGTVRKRLLHLSHDLNKVEAVKRGYYELVEPEEQITPIVSEPPTTTVETTILHDDQHDDQVVAPKILTEQAEQVEQPDMDEEWPWPSEQMDNDNTVLIAKVVSSLLEEVSRGGTDIVIKINQLANGVGATIDEVRNAVMGGLQGSVSIYSLLNNKHVSLMGSVCKIL